MNSAELSAEAFYLWVQRPDGIGFANSSNDRPLEIDGMLFEPQPGLLPGTVELHDDMVSSRWSVTGDLSSGAMTESDLQLGRWTGARLAVGRGSWAADAQVKSLCSGVLGQTQFGEGSFKADVSVVPPQLRLQPCPQTSPECRARLGDNHCRVAMRTRRQRARLVSVNGVALNFGIGDAERFAFGRLRWLAGAAAGLSQAILTAQGSEVELQTKAPDDIAAGDEALLEEGCDGRLETCSGRFDNVENFRGEPHLPGTDTLTRYPGD